MQRADAIVDERLRLAATYDAAFADLDWLQTPVAPAGFSHGYQSYPCLFEPKQVLQALNTGNQQQLNEVHQRRNAWMESLQQKGVSTRPATHAVHMLSFYSDKYQLSPESFRPLRQPTTAAFHCHSSMACSPRSSSMSSTLYAVKYSDVRHHRFN